jgi:hypothetical protein
MTAKDATEAAQYTREAAAHLFQAQALEREAAPHTTEAPIMEEQRTMEAKPQAISEAHEGEANG